MSLLKKLRPSVCGLLVLLKRELDSEGPQDKPPERVLYLRLEQAPAWAQQDYTQKQDVFTRCVFVWKGNEKRQRGIYYTCNCCPRLQVALLNRFPLMGYWYKCNLELSVGGVQCFLLCICMSVRP